MKNLMKPTLKSFDVRRPAAVLLTVTFVLLSGCKKEAEPEALVTVYSCEPGALAALLQYPPDCRRLNLPWQKTPRFVSVS